MCNEYDDWGDCPDSGGLRPKFFLSEKFRQTLARQKKEDFR